MEEGNKVRDVDHVNLPHAIAGGMEKGLPPQPRAGVPVLMRAGGPIFPYRNRSTIFYYREKGQALRPDRQC